MATVSVARSLLEDALVVAIAAVATAGCGDASRAAAPPPTPVVRVEPVVERDVPISAEWVGTLVGYIVPARSAQGREERSP
jgi:hypothetical protein